MSGSGADRIAHERQRQIVVEGWTPEHDDEHVAGELLVAAKAYIEAALNANEAHSVEYEMPPFDWPWHSSWWKPADDPIRNLEKAGALIAAEIDRLRSRP